MPIPHYRIRGKIHYSSDQPARRGQERGREYFTITVHRDGRRTLRAYTEIDDAPNVLRDVVLSLGPDWRPQDCFVRVSVGDRTLGSSWFRFTAEQAECEGVTATEGRISQRMALARPLRGFGTHPIQGDAFLTRIVDISAGPREDLYDDVLMCSLDHRGATGPMLMRHPLGVRLAYLGQERITVAAGTFDALHFRFAETADDTMETRNEPGKHPPYDLWCTADGEYVFLLGHVTGYMMTRYELTEYERIESSP
ncbi:MAG: DUF3108 domain-containing protein [Steroidobacteraceae bacterium]|nr:DUF3108 domain-containing protein [Steroidobacteraceae bacterium]MDW8259809.1 hypothetical protein [Gammaproteobacteria bacterium]